MALCLALSLAYFQMHPYCTKYQYFIIFIIISLSWQHLFKHKSYWFWCILCILSLDACALYMSNSRSWRYTYFKSLVISALKFRSLIHAILIFAVLSLWTNFILGNEDIHLSQHYLLKRLLFSTALSRHPCQESTNHAHQSVSVDFQFHTCLFNL